MKIVTRAACVVALSSLVFGLGQPVAGASNIGNEGCTPGYWKNHTSNWEEYAPSTQVGSAFKLSATGPYATATLEQALAFRGGSGVDGAQRILLRAATAAVLNAAHEDLGYPYRRFTQYKIVATVRAALLSGDRQRMLELAEELDAANNLGCPL